MAEIHKTFVRITKSEGSNQTVALEAFCSSAALFV